MDSQPPPSDFPASHDDSSRRLDDLAQIIEAYNSVTDKLQHSHDELVRQVDRLQAELASADAQLQRSKRLAALGEMAAGIAHEIRNPLAAIRLYAGFIRDDLQTETRGSRLGESAEHAGKIVSAVEGLEAIVNDVLTFSREMMPAPRWVEIRPMLENLLEQAAPWLDGAEVRLEASDDVASLRLDPQLIQQALLNLLRNAGEAMRENADATAPPREDADEITLACFRESGSVMLRVADRGPGVDDGILDRIFNPFFTTRSSGTGLGLAIVHRIAEAHGGTIVAANRPQAEGGGAAFDIVLPAATVEQGASDEGGQAHQTTSEAESEPEWEIESETDSSVREAEPSRAGGATGPARRRAPVLGR